MREYTMEELVQLLNQARAAYYNGVESPLTDHEYDELLLKLEAMEKETGIRLPDSPVGIVGAESVVSGLEKVEHEYQALSLDKTKDIDKLCAVFPDAATLMWKLDGSTTQLTYENGRLVLAATRGDGEVGQNITKNAKYVHGIPQSIMYTGKIVVRGETLMSYSEFERINQDLSDDEKFANPRNLANATLTVLDINILKQRQLNFKAFQLVCMEEDGLNMMPALFHDRLKFLQEQGFDVVPYQVCFSGEHLKKSMEEWGTRVSAYDFPVDGLVVAAEHAAEADTLPGTGHHPNIRRGYAYKWADEEAETTLREIEWSPSRTGLLNPVAVFDPVELEGTTVTRASLHNASYIMGLNLEIGDTITVYKANKIIPQLARNKSTHDYKVEPWKGVKCPVCGAEAVPVTNEKPGGVKVITMVCPAEECPAKHIGRFVHFCNRDCMNIRGVSEQIITKMVNAGYLRKFGDFYRLYEHAVEMVKWDGFGEKAVQNMLDAIEASRHNIKFVQFLHALGIPHIGKGQAKLLLPMFEKDFAGDMRKFLSKIYTTNFAGIDGLGPVRNASLHNWAAKYTTKLFYPGHEKGPEYEDDEIMDLLQYLDFAAPAPAAAEEKDDLNALAGMTFVVTGSLEMFTNRDDIHTFIEKHGGKTSGSVSKKTSYLVNNDRASTSGKNKKAKELGIPVISERDLVYLVYKV